MSETVSRPASVKPAARPTAGLLAVLVMLTALSAALGITPVEAAEPTGSAVTVTAKDYDPDYENSPFPDLKVTVSQTKDLIQQGIKVSWSGGEKSVLPNQQTGGESFLQIMQCWGDEPGSKGARPDRTTCQYGGFNLPGASRWTNRTGETVVPDEDVPYTAPSPGWWEPAMTAIPFRSATGSVVASVVDGARVPNEPDLNNNEFFNKYTTNEVSWAGSGADGSGAVSFELQTAQQSPGLGCGTPSTAAGGAVTGASCWLVIIPRGSADAFERHIVSSGLFWDNWKHHLAIKLEFKPLGLHCAIGAAERQLSGSELVAGAIGQWQPTLCSKTDGSVYSLLTGPESDAALAANSTSATPLALTSRALSAEGVKDELAYAPIALTGVSIAFAVDRHSRPAGIGDPVPEQVRGKDQQAFREIKLTPRLVAKLLTSSYINSLPSYADIAHVKGNPQNITVDPDFLAINDSEWAYQVLNSPGLADLLVPLGRSDAARAVWSYVQADDDAASFLAGEPDPWGMVVNPYFSTKASLNPTGVAFSLPSDEFPKSDPTERDGGEGPLSMVNSVTWRPYASSLDTSGYYILRGDARTLGSWNSLAVPPRYDTAARELPGHQKVMGVTSTYAAAKYQIIEASLLNPAGEYVAPTPEALGAAAAAMSISPGQKQVAGFDPGSASAKRARSAYPLALPVYAAVNPGMDDAELRADYAGFISYAVTDGQIPGTDDGELPPGYAPLPAEWKAQALAAAAAIKAGGWPSPSPSPSPTPSRTARATQAPSLAPVEDVAGSESPTASLTDPSPSGSAAGPLTGAGTPEDPSLGALAAAVPATGLVGLAAALSVPAISRIRQRP